VPDSHRPHVAIGALQLEGVIARNNPRQRKRRISASSNIGDEVAEVINGHDESRHLPVYRRSSTHEGHQARGRLA